MFGVLKRRVAVWTGNGLDPTFFYSWPLATISANEQGIRIETRVPLFRRRYVVRKESVRRMALERVGLIEGIRLYHSAADVPSYLAVWCPKKADLLGELEARGYSVGASRSGTGVI